MLCGTHARGLASTRELEMKMSGSQPTEPAPDRRLLIAEDHEASRKLLETYLTTCGYEVVATDNGEEAWKILEGPNAPGIALLDWMIPGVEGPELCRRVRAQVSRPYQYLVLLTSLSAKDDVAAGLAAGADDYVTKPFDREELRARLAVGQRVVRLERTLEKRVTELESALSDVRRLQRLLPICMFCKRIRDDHDYWRQIEEYIHSETGTDFSHSICPECMERIPDMPRSKSDAPVIHFHDPGAMKE
jgi:phosphoserine phosphatase RsbU/P